MGHLYAISEVKERESITVGHSGAVGHSGESWDWLELMTRCAHRAVEEETSVTRELIHSVLATEFGQTDVAAARWITG
ncbi:MAG: hypothetical protein ACNA8W_07155, partial [Bradymonadaceae bacterium]